MDNSLELKIVLGIVPVISLFIRFRKYKTEDENAGIFPVKVLFCNVIVSSLVRSLKPLGMVPLRLLLSPKNCVRLANSDIEVGMLPL